MLGNGSVGILRTAEMEGRDDSALGLRGLFGCVAT